MSYCQHCTVGKLLSYCLLYQFIGFHVNRCCSFIQNKDLRLAKQCSSQTDQLLLTDTIDRQQRSLNCNSGAKAAVDNLIEKTNLHAEWPLHNYAFFPPRNCLPSSRPLWADIYPTDVSYRWRDEWKSDLVVNFSLVGDPIVRQPGFDLSRHHWSLLYHFRTNQGHCASCWKKWALQQPTFALVTNAKRCHILSTAAHRPSWRVGCSDYTQLMTLPLNSWWHTARKCTRQQQEHLNCSVRLLVCLSFWYILF